MDMPQDANEWEKPVKKGRKGDGGTYLVVADDSEEFKTALRFACNMAKSHRARVGIVHIIEHQDFQHWGAVEGKIKKEARQLAETYLWTIAKTANDFNGTIPSLYFVEGERGEALLKLIAGDEAIVRLVLGTGSSPGPLISYCLGKGHDKLSVPLVVVPGHMEDFS